MKDEIIGMGESLINTSSEEFKVLQAKIKDLYRDQPEKEIINNNLLSLRFQMERYLEEPYSEIIEVGYFLKECVKSTNIRSKTFAEYIGFRESNLSALYTGKRKISIDLAIKLGAIFSIEPSLWIHIQSKNELTKMAIENKGIYSNYSIDDLLKSAS